MGGHLCHVRYRGHESEMCLLTLTKSAFYSQKISFVELPYHLSMCCNRVNTVDRQVNTLLVELVSKELNHLAAILQVYAGGLNFMK